MWFTTLSGMTSIPAVLKWRSPLGRFLHNLIPIQLVMWWGMSSGLYIVCIPMLQPENFTWGPKWPLTTFFRGQCFRKEVNKLKATERKNASGYQGKKSSLLGCMIKFNSNCLLKCFYSIKFPLNQIPVWRICALWENNP